MISNVTFSNETRDNRSYLVGTLDSNITPVEFLLRMVTSNEFERLIPMNKRQKNENIQLCYDITSRISLKDMISRHKISQKNFIQVISDAIRAYDEIAEYQLTSKGIVLDTQYIYVKPDTFDAVFLYMPLYTEDTGDLELRNFIKEMLSSSCVEWDSADFVPKMFDVLNGEKYSREEVKKLLLQKPPRVESPRPQPVQEVVHQARPQQPETPKETPKDIKVEVPKDKKNKNDKKKAAKEKPESKGKSPRDIFLLCQAAVIILVSLVISMGWLKTASGAINMQVLASMVIVLAAGEFILYREIFVNHKDKKPKQKKAGKTSKPGKGRNIDIPGAERKPSKQAQPTPKPEIESVREIPVPNPVQPKPAAWTAPEPKPVVPFDVYDDMMENTVVMDESSESIHIAYLEYCKDGQWNKVSLDKESILLGRLRGQVDFVVDSVKVSKLHAEIIQRNGSYFIKDLNSKNGTYINGSSQRITSGELYELVNDDRIRIADIEFVFKG